MGILTLDQFRDELRFDLRNRNDTGTGGVSDTRLEMWLRSAYHHVGHPAVHRHRPLQYYFTITLAADDNSYAYTPVGGVSMYAIRSVFHILSTTDTPDAQHIKVNPRDIRHFDQRSISSGPPKLYALDGDTLYLDPIPGDAQDDQLLGVRAWRVPALMTADGDTTVLDSVWDEVVLLGARWRAERDLGYVDRAELTRQHYAAMINEYADRQNLETEDWGFMPGIVDHGSPMEASS